MPIGGWATERQPWIGNYMEFEWRNSLRYQRYSFITSDSQFEHYSSQDFFLNMSLSNALDAQFSLEGEFVLAKTRHQRGVDHLRFTGRYVWLDDVAGDDISLTTGLSFTYAFLRALRDISSFHHGRGEGELFISFGKEMALEEQWERRWWAVFGLGIAERGSPWLRGDLTYETRICMNHEWRAFVHTLWGLGHKKLHSDDFHGYGSIQHQSVDLGLRYTYLIDFFGSASAEYSYRVYARNFPAQTHQFLLSILYTFGL